MINRNILIVAAHTDDEALGCGGTIAKYVASGHSVYTMFMTNGVGSRDEFHQGSIYERQNAAKAAGRILGITKSFQLDFPDNQMDTVPLLNIIKQIERVINITKPSIIYTHHAGDLNVDHRITNSAVLTACRPQPTCAVESIYAFEVPSSTEWAGYTQTNFLPNTYNEISDFFELKLKALLEYDHEIRSAPHARSLDNVSSLASYRGYSVGVKKAEAFMLIRAVKR